MSETMKKAIELIEIQQKGLSPRSPVFAVGEQLKDMARESDLAADLLAKDLTVVGMRLIDAEKKIKAFADGNKQRNFGFCPPQEADRILREFYGLPARAERQPEQSVRGKIDLSSFF